MFDPKPRLLFIDDDAQIRRVYTRVLRRDFAIEGEADAAQALRRIAEGERFDVILCDCNLHGMSGQQFWESLSPDLQEHVVICSGAEPAAHNAFAAALGDRFLLKLGPVAGLISMLLRVASVSPRAAA